MNSLIEYLNDWWYKDKKKEQKEREDKEQKNREERERKEREERERKEREEREREERERKARERVTKDIRRLQNEMEVDARAHYLCAEYYDKWKFFLLVLLLIVGGALAGYEALVLGLKVQSLVNLWSKKTAIAVFALGAATFVIKTCYNDVADTHVKHYKAERNCQGIVERAKSLLQRAFSSESASSLRDNYDELLHEKKHSSEIRPEKWANRKALKK